MWTQLSVRSSWPPLSAFQAAGGFWACPGAMLFPISPGSKGPQRCLWSFERYSHLLRLHLTSVQKQKPKRRCRKLKKNVGKKNLQLIKFYCFFFSFLWSGIKQICFSLLWQNTFSTRFDLSLRREGRAPWKLPPKCSTSSGQQWWGSLYVPYSSQARENFRNKQVRGEKKTFDPSISRLPITSSSGEKTSIHCDCFCNQKGDRAAWEEARRGTCRTHSGIFKPAQAHGVNLSLQWPHGDKMCISGARMRLWLHTQKVYEVWKNSCL